MQRSAASLVSLCLLRALTHQGQCYSLSAVRVRCGSERTGFSSYDAANIRVKATRHCLAHPEGRSCQFSGDYFHGISVFCKTVLFISSSQKILFW